MQQFVHLAHRGANVTRTSSARWHPYHHNSLSGGAQVQPAAPSHLVSPHVQTPPALRSSILSAATLSFGPLSVEPSSVLHSKAQKGSVSKETRDKVASLLIDQAVKTLMTTWQPGMVPDVYMTSTYENLTPTPTPVASLSPFSRLPNGQLPSPESPSTRPSPAVSAPVAPALSRPGPPMTHPPKSNCIVPLRSFVHEVLRRSRTSCSTLQTALCYIEAIRSRIPTFVAADKESDGVFNESDVEGRIATEPIDTESVFETSEEALSSPDQQHSSQSSIESSQSIVAIVGVDSQPMPSADIQRATAPSLPGPSLKRRPIPPKPTTPLPPLPHPLLWPRRTFMAALILASKFTQDKSYSNRAWAKLSGLPPREISRCERALGNALEWRLWVGKDAPLKTGDCGPAVEPTVSRGLARVRSEGSLGSPSKSDCLSPSSPTTPRPLSRTVTAPELSMTPTPIPAPTFTGILSPCPTLVSSNTPTSVGSSSSETSFAEFPTPDAPGARDAYSFLDAKLGPGSLSSFSEAFSASLTLPEMGHLGYSASLRGPFIANNDTLAH